ncbi:MAG: UDP-N-acetylglucosamine 1-carboxyvinyltransferase [Alphaproteobacteria bacterium]|nr:UDP-N-acetylglucosamine 1-carboxyvinyltransferase [Alphaproteobacteria bacterium]MDA7983258.1 UDP-N-acetylglucosamine 1-carboxyvinyltransferase [Alphaproteobacteria bacterium]MDA7988944.1 UDP-N-acetylglucosamine 1-carboxyvinyltransferase [Alphaproteobacteria bacterium]MDA8009966.1 UDP-N-acetylglucosamine 1-carboxyvinyltransferase [Alphaproteobacteria bacterium]
MDSLLIRGGQQLSGQVPIAGAKNAALPAMVASLLTDEPLVLAQLPAVNDIRSLKLLLAGLGVEISEHNSTTELRAARLRSTHADYDLVRKMRASVLVLGPLLARAGEAEVSLPGGCAIGARPVNLHVEAMRALGAEVVLENGYLRARARGHRLRGGEIVLPLPSVGATENALMAAVLAEGESRIVNPAREPEVGDLVRCLVAMGARIEGFGGSAIHVQGVERLGGARHRVISDRIEAGTYAIAAAITGGCLKLAGAVADDLEVFLATLRGAGVNVVAYGDGDGDGDDEGGGVVVDARGCRLRACDVATAAHPGFPTDLQAQFMALMTRAEGESRITERIFENRFMHVQELERLGARIRVRGASALVSGPAELRGAQVTATDLRASVSLVLAGLAAEGETVVNRIYHLDRGYAGLEDKLRACGASLERLPGRADVA